MMSMGSKQKKGDGKGKGLGKDFVFTPIKSFEFTLPNGVKSRYLQGLTYTVKPDNAALAALASGWLQKGLIREFVSRRPLAKIEATLTVLDRD